MLKQITWLTVLAGAMLRAQSGIEGNWQGTLAVGTMKLRTGLHITKNASGEFTSTMDSIDQGAMGIPVKVTTFSANKLHLELPNLRVTYDGALSADGNEIAGTFVQGAPFPLTFKRVEKVETVNRPQHPKPPFPYESQEVTYEPTAGIKLAGTLTVPRGQGPFPAALLITGSGPQDRDETVSGHKPFLVIADYLTRRGIAVLRVDDRGMGGSTGNSTNETLDEMAGDVVAGVNFLKARKEIDPKHIGVIGHSEGGTVGPMAALRSQDISFVVMLAGTGMPGDQVIDLQGELMARAAGASAEALAKRHEIQMKYSDIVKSEKDEQTALQKLRAAFHEMKSADAPDDAMDGEFKRLTSPEIRSIILTDPAETLRKLKVPVLALNGSRDVQVVPRQNLPAIVAALTAGGSSDFTVTELPGLNHLFQKCRECTIAEYSAIEETFSPLALKIVGDWILRHK